MNFNAGQSSDPELEHFIQHFFKARGAVLETRADKIEVLLPESVAALLGTPDFIRLARAADAEAPGASDDTSGGVYTLNYGSALLEKILRTACGEMPLLACELHFDYLKSQGFDRLIRSQFQFNGSVGKVVSWAEVKTDYLFLSCRYLAQSDEQKEGLLDLVFNLESGAPVEDMAPALALAAKTYKSGLELEGWGQERLQEIMQWVQNRAQAAIVAETAPFQESMNRRYRRDAANLEEYYASLKKEMEASLQRPGLSDGLIEDRRQKIDLLPAELASKQDDLFKKYSIKVDIKLCGAMLIATPAVKVLYRAAVGRKQKNMSLIYNPATKALDPLVCEKCRSGTYSICYGDRLQLLCPACDKRCVTR